MNLLKSLFVRFTGIRWHKMKQKEFLRYRSVPLLKIKVCFSFLFFANNKHLYLCKEQVPVWRRLHCAGMFLRTGAQNLDLFDYFDFTLTQQIIYIVDIINTISSIDTVYLVNKHLFSVCFLLKSNATAKKDPLRKSAAESESISRGPRGGRARLSSSYPHVCLFVFFFLLISSFLAAITLPLRSPALPQHDSPRMALPQASFPPSSLSPCRHPFSFALSRLRSHPSDVRALKETRSGLRDWSGETTALDSWLTVPS